MLVFLPLLSIIPFRVALDRLLCSCVINHFEILPRTFIGCEQKRNREILLKFVKFCIQSDPRWKFARFFSSSGDFFTIRTNTFNFTRFFVGTESTLQEISSRYCPDAYRKKVNKRLLLCCLRI